MSQAAGNCSQSSQSVFDSSLHQHAPIEETPQGYLQISLAFNGLLQVRGTRSLMDWLFNALAGDGWCVEFEDIRWCG